MLIFKEDMIGVNKNITLLMVFKDEHAVEELDPEFYQATRNSEIISGFRFAREMHELGIAPDDEVIEYLETKNKGILAEWEHSALISNVQLFADEELAFAN